MKIAIIVKLMVLFCLGVAFAGQPGTTSTTEKMKVEKMTIKGTIIDNACANANKENLSSFIATHTKECALMPSCIKSGYSLYTDEKKLLAFDKKSNKKVETFLKNSKNTLSVSIEGVMKGDMLHLISIKNKEL